jgi:hypothetical protein
MAAQEARAQDVRAHQYLVAKDPVGSYRLVADETKKPDPGAKPPTTDELERFRAEAERKQAEADAAKQDYFRRKVEMAFQQTDARNQPPEFKYVKVGAVYAPTYEEFEKAVKDGEADGYTFVGVMSVAATTEKNLKGSTQALVFRRMPAVAVNPTNWTTDKMPVGGKGRMTDAELIARWEAELADLKAKQREQAKAGDGTLVAVQLNRVGGDSASGSSFVTTLVRLKYGEKAAGGLSFDYDKDSLLVKGLSKEQAAWLLSTVNGLSGNKLPR